MRVFRTAIFFFLMPFATRAEPIHIELSTRVEARVSAGSETDSATDIKTAQVSVTGKEQSECKPYGRQSRAASRVQLTGEIREGERARLDFSFSGQANGGHYRTCGKCISRNVCRFIAGNDTEARTRG